MNPRFSQITILHGRDELPSDNPAQLFKVLHGAYPEITIAMPYVPNLPANEAFDFCATNYIQRMQPGSLIVGFERGGLIACALQAKVPALRLSAFAINAPTHINDATGKVVLNAPPAQNNFSRMAIYSSAYAPIKDRCKWGALTPLAFDVPWLAGGSGAYYPLGYLISAFSHSKDMGKEVELMFPIEPARITG